MVKTLKITTLVAAVLCVVLVAAVTALGLKGDPEIEKFLDSPSVIETLKETTAESSTDEQKSPLVTNAQLFALRINPPPPPPPPVVERKPVAPGPTTRRAAVSAPPKPKGPISTSSKFDLLATCRYDDDPDKSLALLSLPTEGLRWVRVGEQVGHLTIAEITNGGLVTAQATGTEGVVDMKEVPSAVRSLLAGDGFDPEQASTYTYTPTPAVASPAMRKGSAYFVPRNPDGTPRTRSSTSRRPVTTSRRPSAYVPPARTRKEVPKPTLEQQKADLDGKIKDIKEMIKEPAGAAGKEKSKDDEMLMKLLQILENERKAADKEGAKAPAGSAKPE